MAIRILPEFHPEGATIAELVENLAHDLAHNLTALRAQRQLSQAQLARLAGIPRSTVTHMESGAGNPSLANLARVAGALKVSLEDLLARPPNAIALIRADRLPTKDGGRGRVKIWRLLGERVGGLEMERLEFRPGGVLHATPHAKGTREYVCGIRGSVAVLVAAETHRLGAGDLLAFPADQPHTYRHAERAIAEILSVVIPTPMNR